MIQEVNLQPRQKGGKGGLFGKIFGTIAGGLLGAVTGGAALPAVAAGASLGGTAGGLVGSAVDPVKTEERNRIAPLEHKAMVDPEVQAAQLDEASALVDATPEISPQEAGPLKDSFKQAKDRLLAARQAQKGMGVA